jgi:transposase
MRCVKVAALTGISQRTVTVQRICTDARKITDERDPVCTAKRRGRPQATTILDISNAAGAFVLELVREEPSSYLREIQAALSNKLNLVVAISTIDRFLREYGFSHKKVIKMLYPALRRPVARVMMCDMRLALKSPAVM